MREPPSGDYFNQPPDSAPHRSRRRQDQRRRRRHQRRPPQLSPSSTVLTLLAALVASSSATDASPLSFLCPSLQPHIPRDNQEDPRSYASVHLTPAPTKRRVAKTNRRNVPVKYERGEDGVWRRVESYTLYGSTICVTCESAVAAEDNYEANISSPTSPSSPPDSTPTLDLQENILDLLPTGWVPQSRTHRTDLVLALSLVLAFAIFFLIIGCLFWRKAVRRKFRNKDVEMRTWRRRQTTPDDDQEFIMERLEKDVKKKKKLWARATARWKANARYSARQRRGRRRTLAPAADSSISVSDTRDMPGTASSRSNSPSSLRSVSRRSSITSQHPPIVIISPSIDESPPASTSAAPQHRELPPSPPAYNSRSRVNSTTIATSNLSIPPSDCPLSATSHHSSDHPSRSPSGSASKEPEYTPSPHAGHVATDDKAVLEQLSQLASSPPSTSANVEPSSSAPIWHDEELDDFAPTDGERARDCPVDPDPVFPPPPDPVAKGKMRYEYDYSFEVDISALEPEPGPSAPPFEESQMDMSASAPPIEYVEDVPSAPPTDDAAPHTLDEEEEADSQAETVDCPSSVTLDHENPDEVQLVSQTSHHPNDPPQPRTLLPSYSP